MDRHEKIDYLEFPAKDLEAIKRFFTALFNWEFQDYGSEYIAFSHQGLDGGFYQSVQKSTTENGSVLTIFYSKNLEKTRSKVVSCGGEICKDIFPFPGGRRFQFLDPNGNEYGVWSDC